MENRQLERLSFAGFSCFLMDQENFAVSSDYGCRLKDVSLDFIPRFDFCLTAHFLELGYCTVRLGSSKHEVLRIDGF